jgi:phosphatidylglycerophosphate synthase
MPIMTDDTQTRILMDLVDETLARLDAGTFDARVSADDIRRKYTPRKARNDLLTQTWVYFVLRPLSFRITPAFVNRGLSANAVTTLGLIPLLGSVFCLLLGGRSEHYFVAGALMYNLWFLLDVVDGNIARYTGRANMFGEMYDWLLGLAAAVLVPLAVGLGLYGAASNRDIFDLGLEVRRWMWPALGLTVVLGDLIRSNTSLRARQALRLRPPSEEGTRVVLWDILPRAFVSFQKPLLLGAALAGWLGVFLLVSALFSITTMTAMIGSVLLKARRFDGQG